MSDAPTIAFYSDSRTFGGAELVMGTLVSHLAADFDVVVVGVDDVIVGRIAAGREAARMEVVPAVRGKWDVGGFRANVRYLRQLRPDILHANLPAPSSCQYVLAATVLTPQVRTVAVEHVAYPLDGWLQLQLKGFTSRHLAAHVAVGEQVARDVEGLARLKSGSVRTIHNGVADIELTPLRRLFEGPIVGTIGRLDRQKGLDVLLRALAALPEARLIIVGDGIERNSLEDMAAELGISQRVRFEGWREEPRRYLTMFDVFVLPSRLEGLPLAILEAMLARLPVVATRVASVAEAVIDGETGFLVAPDDPAALTAALRTLLADPQRRAEMGSRGRQHALRFTPAVMAGAYEQLYREILS